jgi:hypothetical protein
MKKQVTTENHSKDIHDDSMLSPEMILREDEPFGPKCKVSSRNHQERNSMQGDQGNRIASC